MPDSKTALGDDQPAPGVDEPEVGERIAAGKALR